MKKLYYTIGEVSKIVNEEKYVLRYWENEFVSLHPKKNSAGNRSYTDRDIEVIKQIQSLLRDRQMRLKDAKELLPTLKNEMETSVQTQAAQPELIFSEKAEVMEIQEKIGLDKNTKEEILSLLKDIKNFIELEY